MKSFGLTLRRTRRLEEITIEQLSEMSGVSTTFIKSLEKGAQQPSLSTIFRLAASLKISPSELITPAWEDWQSGKREDAPTKEK